MLKCHYGERSVPVNRELREKIPVISFLMMIEVMLYHCESPDNALAVNALDLKLNNAITNFVTGVPCVLCMSWFFAITGFLLFRNLRFQNLGSKLKTRVRTLLIPYLLWQIIYLVKSILQGHTWTAEDIFGQIFLLRIWPPLGAFWYVYAVFLLALLSPIFLLLFKNKRVGWASVMVIVLFFHLFQFQPRAEVRHYDYIGNITGHLPSYLIGAYCGSISTEKDIDKILRPVVGFLLTAALLDGLVQKLMYNMTVAVLPMLILFLIPVPEYSKNRYVYRCTFLMYATHQSLISLSLGRIRSILYALFPSAAFSNLFGSMLCILLIIAVNVAVCKLMSRFAPRTLQILTGGRC